MFLNKVLLMRDRIKWSLWHNSWIRYLHSRAHSHDCTQEYVVDSIAVSLFMNSIRYVEFKYRATKELTERYVSVVALCCPALYSCNVRHPVITHRPYTSAPHVITLWPHLNFSLSQCQCLTSGAHHTPIRGRRWQFLTPYYMITPWPHFTISQLVALLQIHHMKIMTHFAEYRSTLRPKRGKSFI